MRRTALLVLIFLFTGCAGFSNYETVLLRSEEDVPTWVDEVSQNQQKNSETVDIVVKRSNIYNLPLGIKQLQARVELQLKAQGIDQVLPKSIYWEYHQKETAEGTEKYYVIWICISVPKSDYGKAQKALGLKLGK